MRGPRTDLILVAALVVVAAVFVTALPDDLVVLRAPAALALVLALPGYALTAVLFPPAALRPAERTLLAIGLSLVTTIVCALAIHVAGAELDATAWGGSLAIVTVACALGGQSLGHARAIHLRPIGLRGSEIAALASALVLVAAAGTLGMTPLDAPQDTQGTTALRLVPRESGVVSLGIRSDQLRPATYLLDVMVTGRPTKRIGPLRLQPGQTWTRTLVTGPGEPQVSARLRRAEAPDETYRRVALRRGRSLPVPKVKRRVCRRPHPLRSSRGCYRLVLRGSRAYRFYRDGRTVRVADR